MRRHAMVLTGALGVFAVSGILGCPPAAPPAPPAAKALGHGLRPEPSVVCAASCARPGVRVGVVASSTTTRC